MANKKTALWIAVLFAVVCTGCGKASLKETVLQPTQTEIYSDTQKQQEDQTAQTPETENPGDYTQLLKISTFSGDVTQRGETGCKLTPIHYEEDISYSAAPGYEEEWVAAVYQDNCVFQIVTVNVQTGSVTYEGAGIQDVQEQQSLLICGEYDDNNVLQAERVFICRFVK